MSNKRRVICISLLFFFIFSNYCSSQQIAFPKIDSIKILPFDSTKLEQLLQNSKIKPRKEVFLDARYWIHDTYIFLLGFYQGMGFAELEVNLSYETNIFSSEMISSTWDSIGNICLITGSFISGLMLVLPENNFISQENKLLVSGISLGLTGIVKGISSIISTNETNKNENTLKTGISKINDVMPLISVSRQAVDDIKIRKELYSKIRDRIGTSIIILNSFEEYCNPRSTKSDDEIYKYLDDNKSKLKEIGDDLEIAGVQIGDMYDNIESRVNYYIDIYKKFGKKDNEEEIPLKKIKRQIDKERSDPVINLAKNKSYFFVIRDLRLSYL